MIAIVECLTIGSILPVRSTVHFTFYVILALAIEHEIIENVTRHLQVGFLNQKHIP